MIEKQYIDEQGITRLVYVPDEYTPADEGIPASAVLDGYFLDTGCSVEFIKKLYNELWARGLIKPADYLKPRSAELIRAALLATTKSDVFAVQTIARDQDGSRHK